LYLAMVLPWYIEVQLRNPNFLRVFILQHNLERFATDRYEHQQAFWYYVPVVLLSLMPWALLAAAASVSAVRESIAEWRARRSKGHFRGYQRAGDAFPEFLVIWAVLPILFFTSSDSKLPGYILPSIPPITILVGDYLNRIRQKGLNPWLLGGHALLMGLVTTFVLISPAYLLQGVTPPARVLIAAIAAGLGAAMLILVAVGRFGLQRLRVATLIPLSVLLIFIYGVGPVFGLPAIASTKQVVHLLDLTYSPRPVAQEILKFAPPSEPVAVYRVRRDVEYGLSFYRDHRVLDYDRNGIPPEQHILVSRKPFINRLPQLLAGRTYHVLFTEPEQGLIVYQVDAR
jgi:hypothetical protein